MESQELLSVLIKSVDAVKEKLDKLDERVRHVEKAVAESSGRHSGLVTAKDITDFPVHEFPLPCMGTD